MRIFEKFFIPIIAIAFNFSQKVFAQQLFTGLNNTTVSVPCNQFCPTLNFKVPHLKSDEDYTVVQIPYTPYSYTTTTGNELADLYNDDKFSDEIQLPYSICFYGRLYDKIVVGSNGLLTFDVTNKNCSDASYKATSPIPYNGGLQCVQESIYYPRASIMGVYTDLDASLNESPTDRKIEWRIEGAIPFRRFIASWYNIGSYKGNCGSPAQGGYTTFQFVVNEATSVIEVFIDNYTCKDDGKNAGNAILGVQNWERDKAVAAPGKNATLWTAKNEAYRFIPSGNNSRYIKAEIYSFNGTTLRGTATNSFTVPTEVGISFSNMCIVGNSEKMILKTYYASCINSSDEIVISDTITVTRDLSFSPTYTTTNTLCGSPSGSITLKMPPNTGTPPFTYILDGGAPVMGGDPYTFSNINKGTHTVQVADASGGCMATLNNIVVGQTNNLTASFTTIPTACTGAANGSITVTPTNGSSPYSFSLDGGPLQTSSGAFTFTNVAAGSHTIVISDASGCTTNPQLVNVAAGSGITATATPTATSCNGVNNGSIGVSPNNGSAPYTFTLNPGNIVRTGSTANFTNLAPANYTISIQDNIGCTLSTPINVTVNSGSSLTATATPTATSCNGVNNGSIAVSLNNGSAPYTFTLNPGNIVRTGSTANFTNLAAANYTISIQDNIGCTLSTPINVTVNSGSPLTATTATTATSCAGAINGSVSVMPTNGSAPYTYVLDGGSPQTGTTSFTFTNVAAGNHTVLVSDIAGCFSTPIQVTVSAGPALTTSVTVTHVFCNGDNTGSILVNTPTNGTMPYEYSLNGGSWQISNLFNGLTAGNYIVGFRERDGCTGQLTVTVNQPSQALAIGLSPMPVICKGDANGSIVVTTSGGTAPYQYSIDNGNSWQTDNRFTNISEGNYTITVRDNNNCIKTANATILAPSALTATATTSNASCAGGRDGSITVTASGGNGGYTYSSNGVDFQSAAILKVTGGTYDVTIKDNKGCSYIIPDVVVGFTNDMTFAQPNDETICEGDSIQLAVQSNATSYAWTPAEGLSSTTIANPQAYPASTTNYTVTLTRGECMATVSFTIYVNAAPIAEVGEDGFICYGKTYQLTGAGGNQYTWSPTQYLDNPNIANPISAAEKTITYNLTVTDAVGCSSLVPGRVVVNVTPPIKITTYPADTIVHAGVQFRALAKSVITNYTWSPDTWLSDPSNDSTMVTVGAVGEKITYIVSGYTQDGCKGEGTMTVAVYEGPELYTPTAFSPNGDGKNDSFFPFPVGVPVLHYFRVFDRWGNVLFTTKTLHEGWRGKWKGMEQPNGVYIWMAEGLDDKGKKLTRKGTVMLIR